MTSLVTLAVVSAVAFPLLVAAALWAPGSRRAATWLAPWAALPAVLLAIVAPAEVTAGSTWLLLGLRLRVADSVTQVFLLFTSCLWLAAGPFARRYLAAGPRRTRFEGFFLLTLAGNIGLIVAADVATFYLFYALMTFAAYGLVAHEQTDAARRAGRVYVVMALGGEMLLVAAFFAIVGTDIDVDLRDVPGVVAASPRRELLVGFLLAGFGVKAGALLLHLWLPLAHPVAPTPASTVLSGAMIKAGLLGWLRFLPIGVAPFATAGLLCIAGGCTAALYGIAVGLTQRDPKTILAYSSVSQMGFITATLGIGLANPGAAGPAVAAILFYALHHALAKGALFLGTGVAGSTGRGWPGRLVTVGLGLAALDLAGAPLSSGALAKISVKALVVQSPWGATWLPSLLSIGAAGSTLLMIRFLSRAIPRRDDGASPRAGLWIPWASVLLLDVALLLRPPVSTEDLTLLFQPSALWGAAWPVGAGILVAALAIRIGRRWTPPRMEVPPGDVLVLVEALLAAARRASAPVQRSVSQLQLGALRRLLERLQRSPARLLRAAQRGEDTLATFEAIGILFLFLGLVAAATLLARG